MVLWIILQLLFVAVASNGSSVQMCRDDERQALLAFKMGFSIISNESDWELSEREALLGLDLSDWELNSVLCSSAYAKTNSWSSSRRSDCCEWDGVTCHSLSGHVVELDLSCSLLTGSFLSNSTLFLLRRLRHLSLASNNFSSSPIPPGLGQLSDLTFLDLSNSGFSGQVPREIGWLSHLATLDLSRNGQLKMPNFQMIMGANLTHLRKLDLSGVDISSNLPPMIANLSKLAYLGLSDCGLQGEFPAASVLSMPELRVVLLHGNDGIHADFSAVQYWRSPLEVVDFSWCNLFTGKLPGSIGDPSNSSLQSFSISGCQFYGDVPSWMWTVAEDINLSGNHLSGSLPTNVNTTMLAGLSSIDLSGNMVTGIISRWIFTLQSLNYLDLGDNLFTGIGEFDIGNGSIISTSLTTLSANGNRLQGQIPEGIFDLHNLQALDLEGNNLTGTIPLSKLHKLQSLEILSLSDNNLSIIDDMSADVVSTPSWPSLKSLGLSSCNLGHFPGFLRDQVNLESLELSNNGINGVVPHWLLDISNLSYLNLSYNSLSGGLEQLPWQGMKVIDIQYNLFQGGVVVPSPSTIYFSASNNRFTEAIPPPLCDMGALEFLNLAQNNLTENIPDCFASLGALELLNLAQNNLTGNIPDCFTSLISQQLLILDLSQNQLQGVIPSSLFQDCPNLLTLSLSGNNLEGPIPQSLSNCLQLQLLDLSSNKLNHTFPHWLGVLPDLEALILGSNNLQGSLMGSNTTNSFPRLRILDISENDLTGSLSGCLLMSMKAMVNVNNTHFQPYMGDFFYYHDSITAWVKGITRRLDAILNTLVLIDVSRNRFQGPIPEAIGDLVSLRSLNLAHNNFTGHIPSSLSNLTLLESLDLSYNRLDGGIPSELVNINSLEVFNVSKNDLVGPVPTGKQFDTFLDPSYLGNPGLCGPLLTNKCGKPNDAPNPATPEGSSDESSGLHVWEIGLMGYGCGMVIGSAWGYLFFWKMTPKWVLILEIKALAIVHQWRRRQNRRR